MINKPVAGLDPNGRPIRAGTTPDRPGVFLTKHAARRHLQEYTETARARYRILERGVRANGWNISLWVIVPKVWEGRRTS